MSPDQLIIENEASIRLGFFLGIFVLVAIWELLSPRRVLSVSKPYRWFNNIALVFVNTALLRWLFPLAAVGFALHAAELQAGLFNRVDAPFIVAVIVSVVIMDLAIYLQHVMVHAVPALWRLHRVHHADPDFDVTTGSRFHPLEIILSMLIKYGVIMLLGPPVVAVIIFEILLNGMAMFNHGNLRLPYRLDAVLRWLVVTPDMHRVHHSIEHDEANSNFGFNLSWWDRLFGTYRPQPRGGHENMTIGIDTFRQPGHVSRLDGLLLLPFIGRINGYAINRRQWSGQEPHDS